MKQDCLAFFHFKCAAQQVFNRHALQHHRCTSLKANAIGQTHDNSSRQVANLCICPRGAAGVGNAITHFKIGDAFAHSQYFARAFHTNRAGHVLRVQTGTKVNVDVVQANGFVFNLDFASTRLRHVDIDVLHHLWSTGLVDTYSL